VNKLKEEIDFVSYRTQFWITTTIVTDTANGQINKNKFSIL